MKILTIDPARAHEVDAYGSQGFALTHIAAGNVRLSHAVLAPGGRIGRHPASQQQLLLVIDGGGEVSGEDGVFHPITAGQAALWQAGEEHETRSEAGLTAMISEGEVEKLSGQLQQAGS
jgi:quercetin dioxygenase-like cupin family protein